MLSDQNKALYATVWKEHLGPPRSSYTVALNALMDRCRQEGRQSSGESLRRIEEYLNEFMPRCYVGTPGGNARQEAFAEIRALLSPQAAPVDHIADLGEMVPAAPAGQKEG